MKTLRMVLAVAGLSLAGSLFAQYGVEATVPFSFYVGNSQLMPSGTYRISPCIPNAVVVRNCNDGLAVFHATRRGDKDSKAKGKGKLLFHKYGDRFFLSEVRSPSLSTGALVLPITKHEKKVQQEMATVRTFETITVPKEDETKPPNK